MSDVTSVAFVKFSLLTEPHSSTQDFNKKPDIAGANPSILAREDDAMKK
jgi:hypothetical protein